MPLQGRIQSKSVASIGPFFRQTHSVQWRTFVCTLKLPILLPLAEIQGRIPLLQNLSVYGDIRARSAATKAITAFSDAPDLREAALHDISLGWISLPWAQLTRLECNGQSVYECVEILHHTHRLEILSVTLGRHRVGAPPPPIRLDCLHTLTLSAPLQNNMALLYFLTLPALQHLDIIDEASAGKLFEFLTRSQCRLRSISLSADPTFGRPEPFAGVPVLEAVGTVNAVNLHRLASSKDLIQIFSRIATDPGFLPNLDTLCIEQCWSKIPYPEVIKMLQARWYGRSNGSTRFKSFRFARDPRSLPSISWPAERLLSELLGDLVTDGLEFVAQTR
ncbi:hypothetical protein B0H17DRAFT_1201203 [Mycena rosella]|uniref:F-box domain-containing protein n=1 Tax=Mycena rosella TaxID=1033263 RepID=A0AAD7DH21_MYCRO|nr:hypothetical protein B0H17DRAFT_1201203 [Mycena rosella]